MELPPPGNRRVSISNPQETPQKFSISSGMVRHRPSMVSAGTSRLSTLRPQSLQPNPILQRRSLSPSDAPMMRRGSNVSSVRYADEEGQTRSATEKDKEDKEKSKSTGTRLLNMLRKTLKGSQSEEMIVAQETPNLIPFGEVVGCLAVHIKSCRQFSHRFIVQQHVNLFIRISINHVVKYTKLRNLKSINNERNLVLRFDEVKYFSVQVPRRQDDERNNIFLELMQDGGDTGKPALSLGSVESHLYEVIQKGCFTEALQMKHRNSAICRLEVEFMFSYGAFGYGFSHQLKPLQKIIEPSMFMKIAPPPDRTDPATNVITPQQVEYPAFLSPDLNVSIGAPETSTNVVRLTKLHEKPRERLEKMKTEYRHLDTWIEKAEYLRNLITPKVAHKGSEEDNLNERSTEKKSLSLYEEKPEIMTHGIYNRKSETISNGLVDKGDKESLVIPVLKVLDQDLSDPALYESAESIPEETLLPPIHTLLIKEDEAPPRLHVPLGREDRSIAFAPGEALIHKRPSIVRIVSSPQEDKQKKEKVPHFPYELVIPDKLTRQENTNQKGKTSNQLRTFWERQPTDIVGRLRKVAFAQNEYTTPIFRAEYTEFKPKHPKLSKGGPDPFLRNINSKMPFRKKNDQEVYIYPSTLSTEVAEHEDQDPPYPEHSRSAGSNTTWAEDPNLIAIHMVNKNNLPPDHITTTTMTSDRKNKSHAPTLNTTNTSNIKNIFASGTPVITITKISDSNSKLSTDPSFNTTKSSDTRRLPSDSSSQITKPSDMMQPSDSSGPSSHTTTPSDSRLSSGPSYHTTKLSDSKLSSGPTSDTTKPSDSRLSSGPSSHTTKLSDSKLSSGPNSHTTKLSDSRLSSGPSSHTTKPSDSKLSSGPSSDTTKPSDSRLSSGPSYHTTKLSDSKLSSGPSSDTTKPSDSRLSSGPSYHTTKLSDSRLSSGPSSDTTKPSDSRLSSGPSYHTTKLSDSKLSSGPSSDTTKPSDSRLSSGPSSHTTKPSDTRLSSGPSSHTTKPSDSRLSNGPSSHTTKPSDSRLSSGPSSDTTKPSDSRLSSGPSFHTTKASDTRLSSGPSSHTTKLSDSRLSSGPSSHTTKPSDTKLSSGPSSHTTKLSDSRLSSGPSSDTTKPSDSRLSSGPSSDTTKPSDTRLSSGPSSHTTKPSDSRLSSGPSSDTTKPSDSRLSSGPSSHTTKPSDTRLSSGPSSHTTKPSDTRLPSGPSSHTTKLSDSRLSSSPSSNTAKPSDMMLSSGPSSHSTMPSDLRLSNKIKPLDMMLSSGPGSNSTQPSGTNRLSQNPSINGNKSSDLIKLSRDPSTISTKSSDPKKKLSHDPSITSTKSLDSKNKLSSSNRTVNSDLTNTANSPALRDTLALGPDLFTEDSSNMQSELEQLSNVSLPSYQRQSSMTRKVDIFHTLSSINFTSDIEHLKQSIVLKSILSKNLQHLSDELFSKSEVSTNTEPSGRMQDRVFEKVQDINSWFSPKDILNSQTLLSPVIKSVPQDLLPEGGPGTSSDIEHISDRLLEAVETHFPMNRKSSFKTKHLVSEVPASNPGSNGSACDCVVKQILSTPMLSQLETGMTPSEAQMALQDQLFTSWERCVSSQILNYGEKGKAVPLSHPKTGVSKIMQSFPVETLLENGIIKVIELDKENQSSLLNMQTASHKENLQNPTEQHSNVKNQTKLLARQNTPTSNPTDTFVCGADYTEDRQGMSAQESKYPTADKKSDLPNEHQSLDTEEAGPSSTSETLSSLLGRLKDPDKVMLKSCLKNIFNVFKSERKEHPEKEFDRLIQHSSPHGTEHLEKNQENFNKADKEDRKHILDPKLCVFLEKLSESEVKNMKSELGKHIQHYIIEKLSEAGHITKEDLTNIYQNLYQMNEKEEKEELKEQSPFQDKYSETVKEIMSFVNNFNHHFIDKHLEIKLRSFLNEILQNYFLKNLSENNLLNETDGVALCPSVPSLRNKSTQGSLHGLMQDISSGSFGSRLKINMNYPLNESLQNNLKVVSENELLSIKADLSEYFQVLFKDKLHKSELMTERQLKGINEQVNSITSPPTPLKHIKTDLSFRDESYFMREDLEEQIKYSKIGQNATLQIYLEEAELARKQEKGSAFSHNLKENPPTIWDHKHVYSREVKALNVIKVQSPNKNIKANLLNKSPERPSDLLLKKHKKDHGFMQLPQAENSVYKTETQEPYSWDGRSKTIQSKPFFEKTLKVRPLDKRENNNNCKLTAQEKPDTGFSPYLKLPTCKMSRENEHLNRLSFPTWRANTLIYVNPESGEQSKLDQYCQRWKGSNNNNKKHLVTFAQFKNEMENLYINPYEACNEKCAKISDSQSFKHKGNEKNSRPFFFPEVLKKENMKSTRKESDYAVKSKKSLHKIVRILPATLPPTRPHLRKSVPRTLLHWTARKTIHDCLDRYEDLQIPPVKPPKNSKSRARLLGKSPDDSNNRVKHCARPYTAPEPNKRRESIPGKFASPRMVSAGLVHIHDTTTPEYEIRKIRSKRKLKENIEKRPLICDIIRMIDTAE